MKALVTSQCMGDRNCNKFCPEAFQYDEDQLLSVVQFDVIPEKYEDILRQAADKCGANAIEIAKQSQSIYLRIRQRIAYGKIP